METFRVTKSIEIDYGHRVPLHKSHCRNVHGHRGKIEVTVEGPLQIGNVSEQGMVLDFGDIKAALETYVKQTFDHKFLMYCNDNEMSAILVPHIVSPQFKFLTADELSGGMEQGIYNAYHAKGFGDVVELPCVPTAENLARICFQRLARALDDPFRHIQVLAVRFWETPNSVAEYCATTRS